MGKLAALTALLAALDISHLWQSPSPNLGLGRSLRDADGGHGHWGAELVSFTNGFIRGFRGAAGPNTDLGQLSRQLKAALMTRSPDFEWGVWIIRVRDGRYEDPAHHYGFATGDAPDCDQAGAKGCGYQGSISEGELDAGWGRVGWALTWTLASKPRVWDAARAHDIMRYFLVSCFKGDPSRLSRLPDLAGCVVSATGAPGVVIYAPRPDTGGARNHDASSYDPAGIVDVRHRFEGLRDDYGHWIVDVNMHVLPPLAWYAANAEAAMAPFATAASAGGD